MSPVTVAGTATQILAEVLAGIAFSQLVRPGAPAIFGTFASSISMQSGAPTFGTPEPQSVTYIAAALARASAYRFVAAVDFAVKIPDAQAAFEAANTLQHAMLAGVNFMLHVAGWLEGGLSIGYEKFIMDTDQAAMMQVFLGGVDMSENGQAMEAIREVGPGQHYLGCAHTQANFESAFYRSPIHDNNSYEQWAAEGSQDLTARANSRWKAQLESYTAPALDPAINEALNDFVARRKSQMPDMSY